MKARGWRVPPWRGRGGDVKTVIHFFFVWWRFWFKWAGGTWIDRSRPLQKPHCSPSTSTHGCFLLFYMVIRRRFTRDILTNNHDRREDKKPKGHNVFNTFYPSSFIKSVVSWTAPNTQLTQQLKQLYLINYSVIIYINKQNNSGNTFFEHSFMFRK